MRMNCGMSSSKLLENTSKGLQKLAMLVQCGQITAALESLTGCERVIIIIMVLSHISIVHTLNYNVFTNYSTIMTRLELATIMAQFIIAKFVLNYSFKENYKYTKHLHKYKV